MQVLAVQFCDDPVSLCFAFVFKVFSTMQHHFRVSVPHLKHERFCHSVQCCADVEDDC